MKEYIEHTCGECIHSEICEHLPTLTGWDALNPVYCRGFRNAADVVERKRGEWVDISCVVHDPDGDWIATQYQCSLCGRKEYRKEPFCNCGADMREVDPCTE